LVHWEEMPLLQKMDQTRSEIHAKVQQGAGERMQK